LHGYASSVQDLQACPDGKEIPFSAKAADLARYDPGYIGHPPELLSLMNVGYVDFDRRPADGCNGVADSNTGMRVGCGVDDQHVVGPFLDGVDNLTLAV